MLMLLSACTDDISKQPSAGELWIGVLVFFISMVTFYKITGLVYDYLDRRNARKYAFEQNKKQQFTAAEDDEMTPYESDSEVFKQMELDENFKGFVNSFKNVLEQVKEEHKDDNLTDDDIIKECVRETMAELNLTDKVYEPISTQVIDDASTALSKLGYKQKQIKNAVSTIVTNSDSHLTADELVIKALQLLNK